MINYRDNIAQRVSLIPSAAALSAEDRTALVNDLETMLRSLAGKPSNKLESHKVKKRVEVLTEIQSQLNQLEAKFFEERTTLKAQQKLYQEEGHVDIWLYKMKNNEVLAKEITERDEGALKHLKDIQWRREDNPEGFSLEFFFRPNTYFTNAVLTKTYHSIGDNNPILEKAIGTKIKWCSGKSLTKNCPSFFNFFKPPQAKRVQSRMQRDYDIFSTVLDKIIPPGHQGYKSKGIITIGAGRDREKMLKTVFLEDRTALEEKYLKLYEPLYTKRYEIINGITEVRGVKKEAAKDQGEKAIEEKGVPYFWVTAMKNDEVLAQKITQHDEGALKYLKDIKWCRTGNSNGLKLEFFFDPNPYFKNSVLTKSYFMTSYYPHELEKAIGTKIKWYPGRSLIPNPLKRPRKRSKNAEYITKIRHRLSFFNFFNTPEYPGFPWDSSNYAYYDNFQKMIEQFKGQRELDYEVGKTIRDKIIHHAISLFTGAAVEQRDEYEDFYNNDVMNDDNDSDSDDDDDDDDDEEEEDEYA